MTNWKEKLAHWINTQHGTAGWEQKLENFIESLLSAKEKETKKRIAKNLERMKIAGNHLMCEEAQCGVPKDEWGCYHIPHNEALDDAITSITSE